MADSRTCESLSMGRAQQIGKRVERSEGNGISINGGEMRILGNQSEGGQKEIIQVKKKKGEYY